MHFVVQKQMLGTVQSWRLFKNSFTVSYSKSGKGTAATLVVRQLVTALNNCNFKAEKCQVSLRLYLSF